jgi:hypothetical protein
MMGARRVIQEARIMMDSSETGGLAHWVFKKSERSEFDARQRKRRQRTISTAAAAALSEKEPRQLTFAAAIGSSGCSA